MKKIKLIILAAYLWIYGLILSLFKKTNSIFYKKNTPLSAKHIVFLSKQYEEMLNKWSKREVKFILSVLNGLST